MTDSENLPAAELREGLVVRTQSGFCTVLTDAGKVVARLRGRLKIGRQNSDIIAIGDRVKVTLLSDGSGAIEAVHPRQRALIRLAPTSRGVYREVLLANPDQVLLIFACADPEPHLRMLDRFLVICEKQAIPATIVANKVDLIGREPAEQIFGHYVPLGYPVIYTSVKARQGLTELEQALAGKISGFSGPSGVGKSSLLNTIQAGLGLAVREVSETTGKGRHTTQVPELYALQEGGFVADMPGIKALALWDTEPEELDGYFPELRTRVAQCQFSDCTHRDEPGCAVRQAVQAGEIHPERYESYLRLRYADSER